MRILLIQAKLTFCAGNVMMLMNLPALSSYLKRAGYREVEQMHLDAIPEDRNAVEGRLRDFKPDIVGIGAMTAQAKSMHELARLVKKISPGTLVIAGGPHTTHYPQDCAANEAIDVMIQQEGEASLLEVVRHHEEKRPFDGIKGIAFRRGTAARNSATGATGAEGSAVGLPPQVPLTLSGTASQPEAMLTAGKEIVRTPPREFIEDLDSLPLPDWDAVDFDAYRRFLPCSMLPFGKRVAGIMTSRGCPYHCTFCHNQMGKEFRAQSPARVVEEISILYNKYGCRDIEIMDDIVNFDKDRMKAILRGLIASGIKPRIYMAIGLRGDLLDEETIDLFEPAGVVYLTVAVETGSPRIQKLLKKNIALDKMTRMINYAAKKRIFVHGLFLFGFPQETVEDMWMTLRYACKSKLHSMMIGTCFGFRGTELGDTLDESKVTTPDNDRAAFSSYNFVNCSSLSDRRIKTMKLLMNLRFYFYPPRIFRILRDLPFYNADLFKMFLRKLLNKFILFK